MEGAVAEKFNVRLVSDDGSGNERVTCQIGLDGLFILSLESGRTLRKYPLNHISRWAARGTSLVLYTKTPVDVEERTVTLQADESTIRSMLDTLTCCCMQMCELLNNNEGSAAPTNGGTSNPYTQLLNGGKKKAALPTADEVEFWKDPEQAGWMMSQGEHIRTWRRRWFVLKQGYLYRFATAGVTSSSKPRGVVDLSKVTDVQDGRAETGKPNSLKLATSTGKVCYVIDSETELVEWMSALEGAVNRIVRRVAGIEDEAPAPAAAAPSRASGGGSGASGRGAGGGGGGGGDWRAQLERSYSSVSGGGGGSSGGGGGAVDRNTAKVTIVGYEGSATAPPASHYGGSGGGLDDYGGYGGGSGLNYGSITGLAGVVNHTPPSAPEPQPLVHVDYGAYPVPPFAMQQQQQQPASAPGGYPGMADHSGGGNAYGGYMDQLGQLGHQQQQTAAAGGYQAAAAAAPAPPAAGSWQVLYTDDGRAYYHDPTTGTTQWEAPTGMA